MDPLNIGEIEQQCTRLNERLASDIDSMLAHISQQVRGLPLEACRTKIYKAAELEYARIKQSAPDQINFRFESYIKQGLRWNFLLEEREKIDQQIEELIGQAQELLLAGLAGGSEYTILLVKLAEFQNRKWVLILLNEEE